MTSGSTPTRSHVLVSLRPRFADLVLDGSKTTELRRGPSRIDPGTIALVYASTPVRALVGAARITEVHTYAPSTVWRRWGSTTGLQRSEFHAYVEGCQRVTALVLGTTRRFPVPISLQELRNRSGSFVVPQSYRFLGVEELGTVLNGERSPLLGLEVDAVASLRTGAARAPS